VLTASELKTITRAGNNEARILDLFYHRGDVWPYQWYSREHKVGGYAKACAHRPPWVIGSCQHKADGRKCGPCHDFAPIPADQKIIALHLRGMVTAGAYQIGIDGSTVRWLCLDFDDDGEVGVDELRGAVLAARIALAALQVPTVAEASGGKGWRCHLWGFFLVPIPAIKARVLMDAALRDAHLSDKTYIERFPKQIRALNGYGNLVKIPFGVNRKTGNRSYLLDDDYECERGYSQSGNGDPHGERKARAAAIPGDG